MTYRIEHPLLDSCIPKSAKFIEYCKNERWEFAPNGVDFYSFKQYGVCRCQEYVNEVNCPRSLLCLNELNKLTIIISL